MSERSGDVVRTVQARRPAMRARTGVLAGVVVASIALAAIGAAIAEPVRTSGAVVLRKRPGEKAAVVAKLATGTVVVVEGTEGRWLRVRAGKAVGYLARTSVTGGAPPRGGAAGAWSAPRRAGGAPSTELFVEVIAEASTLRADPRGDAGAIAELSRGARLAVVDASTAGWIRARDPEGRTGWIARGDVGDGTAAVAVAATPRASDASDAAREQTADGDTAAAAPPRGLALRAAAGIGYRSIGMDFSSSGSGLGNYLLSADASAAAAVADATLRLAGRFRFGIDARVAVSRSWGGVEYEGPSGRPDTIAFSTLALDAGVRAGARLGRAFELALRAGGHYDAFVVADVDNTGMLPRESLVGLTLGARVDLVPPRSRVAATAHVDALVAGARAQTPGLEDGTSSTARALWVGVGLRIRLSRRISLDSAVELARATTTWSGMSSRDPSVTSAHRVDSAQVILVGLSAEL
jgi:SH3-like domain-containing protein